jgi:hypothetical protein
MTFSPNELLTIQAALILALKSAREVRCNTDSPWGEIESARERITKIKRLRTKIANAIAGNRKSKEKAP